MARADVERNNPYGAYTVWIDVLVSQHGNRSHQWDGACWGQLDHKPVGGGPGSKPTFATGHRLYELRINTERKAHQTQNCEALLLLISHKNPDLCAIKAIGEKELYLRVSGPAGLAKPTCKLADWLTPQGSFRPASVTPLRASQYCETSTISAHGKPLKEYANQAGLDPIGGPVCAMRNFVVQATGGDASVEAEAARHLTLHSGGRDVTKRDAAYGNEHISALLATIGYGTGLARESCCAHHRVLHFYLGTNAGREVIVYLLSRLLPATEWEQRCAAMEYEGSNVKALEFQYKHHFLTLEFCYTHTLVVCHARGHNDEALIDKDAKPLLERSERLQMILAPILADRAFLAIKEMMLKEETFDISLGSRALLPENNMHSAAMSSALTEQHMRGLERRLLAAELFRPPGAEFDGLMRGQAGSSREALAGPCDTRITVADSWQTFVADQVDSFAPAPAPAPKPLELPTPPSSAPVTPQMPQPGDFCGKMRKFPEQLRYFAQHILPLEVNDSTWRLRAWPQLHMHGKLPQSYVQAKHKFYLAVDYMVYKANFTISAITDVVRDFESSDMNLTAASKGGKGLEPTAHKSARDLVLGETTWRKVQAAILESARAPPPAAAAAAAAAAPPPPTKFYLGIDPAKRGGFARFDMALDGRVATITGSSRKFSEETGAGLNAALDHISAAVAGAEHVFYEEYHKSKGYRQTLCNFGYRAVIEMACAKAGVPFTHFNPRKWPAANNPHGMAAATPWGKDAYKAALEARFRITVPPDATSDAVDAVCIALYGLSLNGIRPERQPVPPVFKWE